MKTIKKVSIILLIIIATLISTIITYEVLSTDYTSTSYVADFDFSKWVLGANMGINSYGTTDNSGNKYAEGFQRRDNLNFYCVEEGQTMKSGLHTIKAILTINGDKASGETTEGNLKDKNTAAAKKANRILSEIIRESRAVNPNETYTYKYPNGEVGEYKIRERENWDGSDISLSSDVYQRVIWNYFPEWKNTVFGTGTVLDNYISSNASGRAENQAAEAKANEILQRIKNKTYNTTSDVSIENDTSAEKFDTSNVVGEYTEIGPFTLNYGGTITDFNVYYNGNKNNKASEFKIIEYSGTTAVEKTKETLPNGKPFYIRVLTSEISDKEKVGISAKVQGESELKTTIYILANGSSSYQNFMYVNQETTPKEDEVDGSYPLEHNKEVIVEKQDAEGNTIKVSGVKFEIYDEENNLVATLETNENGKTEAVDLRINKTYTIKEVSNPVYGYKHSNIEGATITGGTITVSDGIGTFSVSEDSVIIIKNQKELIEIEVEKEGKDGQKLESVEFVIGIKTKGESDLRYLRLYNSSGEFVEYVTGDVTINENNIATVDGNEYKVEYSSDIVNKPFITLTDAEIKTLTKFKTNSDGIVIVRNLEANANSSSIYEYEVCENSNTNYGYKIWENRVDNNEPNSVIVSDENKTGTITNDRHLGNLKIEKYNADNKDDKLHNVQFVIEINDNQTTSYLALYDENNQLVKTVTGTATINTQNIATGTEYRVEYVSSQSEATIFITDSNGEITINNLEVYGQGVNEDNTLRKYKYKAIEINNEGFGYINENIESEYIYLERETTEIIGVALSIPNEQYLGNISLIKNDQDYTNIKLENVEFVVQVSTANEETSYLALYDASNNLVEKVIGTATINSQNIATETEYRVEYVSSQDEATIFVTDSNGEIKINNLEVYKRGGDKEKDQYTYTLIEISNTNYGYIVDSNNLSKVEVKVQDEDKTETTLGNKQELIKISGYVWIEKPQGKSNGYDSAFTNNSEFKDKKLTDLYTGQEGNLNWNANAEIPVKIQLYKGNELIKEQPDAFNYKDPNSEEFNEEDGKYTFTDLEIDSLGEYRVVFIYEGFYYSTVIPNQGEDKTINSKAKELESNRTELNEKFAEVQGDGKVISTTGKTNQVTYKAEVTTLEGNNAQIHQSKVDSINIQTSVDKEILTAVSADTSESVNLADELKALKTDVTKPVEEIPYINMGLVLREQPDLSIVNDIEEVEVSVNGYKYIYEYATRNNYTEKTEKDLMGVKFENSVNVPKKYTRTIYASDIEAAINGTDLTVSIIYKMTVINESRTLAIEPKEINNYFDNRYTIESVSSEAGAIVSHGEAQDVQVGETTYKVAPITYRGQIAAGEQDIIRVKFNVNEQAIIDLLNQRSTHHNAVEISKYASYYTNTTGTIQYNDGEGKIEDRAFTTDRAEAGSLYSGIDEDSAPGNIVLILKQDERDPEGTWILDTSKYEDDEDAAPSLILEAGEERAISGIVWEDGNAKSEESNERVGDGIYDAEHENTLAGVNLELWQVQKDENGNVIGAEQANYSNGQPAITETLEDGKYTFGYSSTDESGKTTYVGVLPGTYFIKYVYNNGTYITNPENNINALEYKSTVVKFTVNETEINDNLSIIKHNKGDKWYLENNDIRYSDAVDNMKTREQLAGEMETVNNATYQNVIAAEMDAKTPIMEIGIEFTAEDRLDGQVEYINRLENIDFGIIERPRVKYEVIKQITGLEMTAQTGTNIVPKGNPYADSIPNVRTLKGQVSIEVDTSLLQGATLKLEYKISIENISELDYEEPEYYYYGKDGSELVSLDLDKVVDYLDETIKLDPTKQTENEAFWTTYTIEQLETDGLVDSAVLTQLQSENYTILVTDQFKGLKVGDEPKAVMLYASKQLATGEELNIYNDVEIIEISGGRIMTGSIPGNYIPTHEGTQYKGVNSEEEDNDRETFVILDPTGTTVNYIAYIIAIGATFAILVTGIIIIKKKVIK